MSSTADCLLARIHDRRARVGVVGLGCIPIDPFYLSWTAKPYGFEPRSIEHAISEPHPHVFKLGAPPPTRAETWRPLASSRHAA